MEMKEYVKIFRENIEAFLIVVVGVVFLGVGYYAYAPDDFKTHLNLDVTRIGKVNLSGYEYDEFYRLQADERFADTVVRWLDSGRFKSDILADSGVSADLKLKARRLSSQMIEVTYVTPSEGQSLKVADSISKVINDRSKKLNEDQKNASWFKVVADNPFIEKNKICFWKMIAISASLGVFLGVWTVFIRHYFRK